MLATVGFARLDLFRTSRDFSGKRKYLHPRISEAWADSANDLPKINWSVGGGDDIGVVVITSIARIVHLITVHNAIRQSRWARSP